MVPLFLVIGVQENLMGQRMHVFFYLLQPARGCKLQGYIFIWAELFHKIFHIQKIGNC